ncbi:TrlF family AAA-like ATPase [Arthrobacter sp. TMN-49]
MDTVFSSLQEGASWHRCALQVNPFAYLANNAKESPEFADEESYNSALIEALQHDSIDVIAITDHWCVDSSSVLRKAATAVGITVFPGFEATAKDGAHLLVLFDPAVTAASINRRIGECGIPDDCLDSRPGSLDTLELLAAAKNWGAVVVAPHVTTGGGLLDKLSGQTAINAWTSPQLHAVALGGVNPTQGQNGILSNKTPDYKRDNPIAILNAADITHPSDVKKSGSSCWIKLSSRSINGLDLAFRTPETRITREDPSANLHARVVGISWEGGFLDGVKIRFNESLNVLIGGRGSGKSTVLESIRYVLGISPLTKFSQDEHASTVKNVLGAGTTIHAQIEVRKPALSIYTIERTVGKNAVVRDLTGQILNSTPRDLIGGTEVYGQRELAELARHPQKLTQLLSGYLPDSNDTSPASATSAQALSKSRTDIVSIQDDITDLDTKLARKPIIDERLARFDEAGVAEKLTLQEQIQQEEVLLKRSADLLKETEQRSVEKLDAIFLTDVSTTGLPNAPLLKQVAEAMRTYNAVVETVLTSLNEAKIRTELSITAIRTEWEAVTSPTRDDLAKVLRGLQPEGIDGSEYLKLRGDLNALTPLQKTRDEKAEALDKLLEDRDRLLANAEASRIVRLRDLTREAKKVGRRLKGTVQASILDGADRTPVISILTDQIGGRLDHVRTAISEANPFSPRSFVELIRQGADAIQFSYPSISVAQSVTLSGASEEALMLIEEVDLPISTDLELNVGPKAAPVWRSLGRLSTGQKATALLLLLLHRGDGPLIIDQPEDDLDNRFIYEDIVPKLRETKGNRQVIFSSHNANIPVLGDADQIVSLAAEDGPTGVAGQIVSDGLGSIDHPPVRMMVEELLEGGREAFNARRYLYGF